MGKHNLKNTQKNYHQLKFSLSLKKKVLNIISQTVKICLCYDRKIKVTIN